MVGSQNMENGGGGGERGTAETMRRLVGLILADSKPSLGRECLALVTGIGFMGCSMAEIANRHGVTRAAVSRRCNEIADTFGLQSVRAMRSNKNRRNCMISRFKSLITQ